MMSKELVRRVVDEVLQEDVLHEEEMRVSLQRIVRSSGHLEAGDERRVSDWVYALVRLIAKWNALVGEEQAAWWYEYARCVLKNDSWICPQGVEIERVKKAYQKLDALKRTCSLFFIQMTALQKKVPSWSECADLVKQMRVGIPVLMSFMPAEKVAQFDRARLQEEFESERVRMRPFVDAAFFERHYGSFDVWFSERKN